MYSIYVVTNKINGKVYIGKTSRSIEKRWALHLSDAKKRRNIYFRNAIMKYGPENFRVCVIGETRTNDQANKLEKFYIRLFQSHIREYGYNSTMGGEGVVPNEETRLKNKLNKLGPNNPLRGRPLSKEHREKVVAALYGRPVSQETRIKIGNANRGRIFTAEQKARMGRGNIGKQLSEEHKRRLVEAHLGRKMSQETKDKISATKRGKVRESTIQNGDGNTIS